MSSGALDAVRFAGASLASGTNVRDGLHRLCRALGGRLGAVVRLANEPEAGEVAIPMEFMGQAVGTLCIRRDRPLNEEERDLVEACAVYASAAAYAEKIAQENERLQFSAARDPVTGVANRQAFDAELARAWATASRDGSSLSLIMMDIDWFKKYNDNYGHVAGDACLARVAQAAQSCLKRETDLFARFGGEEFVALLWSTGASEARDIAENIRAAVEALDIPHLESPIGHVTISVGLAACQPQGGDADALKRASDRALYAAKTSGRDRVVVDRLETAIGASTTYRGTNNLRAIGTSFLGRSEDAAALAALMDEHRLVTIVGPGGAGKTRLALAIGQRNVYAYLDGAWFVDFAAIAQAELVESTIAALLGGAGGDKPGDAIVRHVAKKNMLLIFDNCEHLREPIARVARSILAAAPAVRIIATSREGLKVEGEALYHLGPLDGDTAVRLFVERAQAAFPLFAPNQNHAPALQKICERLDNLPLAIELAAPLVKTMSLDQIHRGLEDRFRLLAGTERDAGAGQRTLFATLDWSINLLPPDERCLLENLSVLPSAATADAVRDVCAFGGIESWEIMGLLNALIEKNLVSAIDRKANERFVLLESTRDFARRGREARGDGDALERRFIHYYAALSRRIGEMSGDRLEQCIAVATADWANLEAALERSIERRIDLDAGIGMAMSLSTYWVEAGRHFLGARWIDRALAAAGPESPHRARLLYTAATLAYYRGDFVRHAEIGEQLVALYEEDDDDHLGYARALTSLGAARYNAGHGEAAQGFFERALVQYRAAHDARGTAASLMNLASTISEFNGDLTRASSLYRESLEILRTLGPTIVLADSLVNLSILAAKLGDHAGAIAYAQESVDVYERLGNRTLAAWPLIEIATNHIALGNGAESARYLRRAAIHLAEEPSLRYMAMYAEAVFYLLCETGRYERAALVYGFVERYRSDHKILRLPGDTEKVEAFLARLREKLGAERFETLTTAGARLEFAQIAAELEGIEAA